ncbi:MAG: TrkA family potassium uptake protein [Bdellovibrionales bacterium]|nr:TrkA family potassium uptake protein [Bdellovibrionales bacterium]
MKKICVIGLGRFGAKLADALEQTSFEVLAVDKSESAVAAVRDKVSSAVIADATSYEALQALVAREFEIAVVSMAEDLEASVLCVLHLKRLNVEKVIAKAFSREHAEILQALGTDEVLFPEWDAADELARRLANPNLVDYLPLAKGYQIGELTVPESFAGKTLAELDLRKRYHVLVVAVSQLDRDELNLMPDAETALPAEGKLVVFGKSTDIERLGK